MSEGEVHDLIRVRGEHGWDGPAAKQVDTASPELVQLVASVVMDVLKAQKIA